MKTGKSTKKRARGSAAQTQAAGPMSKGWKDADYNEGGGLKDRGGRAPQRKRHG